MGEGETNITVLNNKLLFPLEVNCEASIGINGGRLGLLMICRGAAQGALQYFV